MDNEQLLRVAEVAAELGVSEQTIRRMAKGGELPVIVTDGGHRRFRREDVLVLKAERVRKQIEGAVEATEFFEDRSPSEDGKVSIHISPGMSFGDLVNMNPHVAEELLRAVHPRLEQFIQNPAIEAASRLAKQWEANPVRKDIVRGLQKLSAMPDVQATIARSVPQIAALNAMEPLQTAIRQATKIHVPSGVHNAALNVMCDQFGGENNSLSYQRLVQQVHDNLGDLFKSGSLMTAMNEQVSMFSGLRLRPDTLGFFAGVSEEWRKATFGSGMPLANFTSLFPPVPLTLITDDFLSRLRTAVETYGPAFERARRAVEEDERTIAAFEAIEWPVAPSMPRRLKHRVVQLQSEGNNRGAILAILGYYRRNECRALVDAMEGWGDLSHFAPRLTIVRDAVWAHRARKYTLSVPALLPQAEGVMFDVLGTSPGRPKDLSKEFVGTRDEWYFHERATAATLLTCLTNNTYNRLEFDQERSRLPHRRRSNRHSISHGVTTAYATEGHSLKAFLLLDAIAALIRAMVEQETVEVG